MPILQVSVVNIHKSRKKYECLFMYYNLVATFFVIFAVDTLLLFNIDAMSSCVNIIRCIILEKMSLFWLGVCTDIIKMQYLLLVGCEF